MPNQSDHSILTIIIALILAYEPAKSKLVVLHF